MLCRRGASACRLAVQLRTLLSLVWRTPVCGVGLHAPPALPGPPALQECAAGTAMGAMLGSLIFLLSLVWHGISTDVGLTVAIALPVRRLHACRPCMPCLLAFSAPPPAGAPASRRAPQPAAGPCRACAGTCTRC